MLLREKRDAFSEYCFLADGFMKFAVIVEKEEDGAVEGVEFAECSLKRFR